MTLLAWLFSLACSTFMGIDDAAGTLVGTQAHRRRGFASSSFRVGGDVISEQNEPPRTAVKAVFDTFSVAMGRPTLHSLESCPAEAAVEGSTDCR